MGGWWWCAINPQVPQKNKDWVTNPEILPNFESVYFSGSSTWQVSALVLAAACVLPFTSYLLPCGFNNLNTEILVAAARVS
nr:hypothetical protein [Nostoc sp. EkiNYC01]